jgi:hypothetical protein
MIVLVEVSSVMYLLNVSNLSLISSLTSASIVGSIFVGLMDSTALSEVSRLLQSSSSPMKILSPAHSDVLMKRSLALS